MPKEMVVTERNQVEGPVRHPIPEANIEWLAAAQRQPGPERFYGGRCEDFGSVDDLCNCGS